MKEEDVRMWVQWGQEEGGGVCAYVCVCAWVGVSFPLYAKTQV